MILERKIPLLYDHHNHSFMYAALSECLSINNILDKEDAMKIIMGGTEKINIILGWNNSNYIFNENDFAKMPPSLICNTSFHSIVMNQAAKDLLMDQYEDIITCMEDTLWIEKNLQKVINFVASLKPCNIEQLKQSNFFLANLGIWKTEDLLLISEDVILYFEEINQIDRVKFWVDLDSYMSLSSKSQGKIYGIKIIADGSLGCMSAKLQKPYFNGENGFLIYKDTELYMKFENIYKIGKAVAVHAIGDATTDQILRVLKKFKQKFCSIPEIRIEHCQFISKENAVLAKELGISLCMQPNFSIDSLIYTDRLPKDYLSQNNNFRMLIDEAGFVPGYDLFFGSDAMPSGVKPALECALFPAYLSQVLTIDEFVAGYCVKDYNNGYIDVVIDTEKKTVLTDVKLI
jgi:predicted amidohydrolase YtcJ